MSLETAGTSGNNNSNRPSNSKYKGEPATLTMSDEIMGTTAIEVGLDDNPDSLLVDSLLSADSSTTDQSFMAHQQHKMPKETSSVSTATMTWSESEATALTPTSTPTAAKAGPGIEVHAVGVDEEERRKVQNVKRTFGSACIFPWSATSIASAPQAEDVGSEGEAWNGVEVQAMGSNFDDLPISSVPDPSKKDKSRRLRTQLALVVGIVIALLMLVLIVSLSVVKGKSNKDGVEALTGTSSAVSGLDGDDDGGDNSDTSSPTSDPTTDPNNIEDDTPVVEDVTISPTAGPTVTVSVSPTGAPTNILDQWQFGECSSSAVLADHVCQEDGTATVVFAYCFAPQLDGDWYWVRNDDKDDGGARYDAWAYANNAEGQVQFSGLTAGSYLVGLMRDSMYPYISIATQNVTVPNCTTSVM